MILGQGVDTLAIVCEAGHKISEVVMTQCRRACEVALRLN